MKTLPILFSTNMVRAILENRKKMTRRTQGLEYINKDPGNWIKIDDNSRIFSNTKTREMIEVQPRFETGDHIWVKETYYAYGYWVPTGELTKSGKNKYKFIDITIEEGYKYLYNVESDLPNKISHGHDLHDGWVKRPALFMPKKASRIRLKCTGVRCEILQDISKADAINEGIDYFIYGSTNKYNIYYPSASEVSFSTNNPILSFMSLWESINGEDSWDFDTWVFVYEFTKIVE